MNSLTQHTVKSFDDELHALTAKLAAMGGQAEQIIDQAVTALANDDLALASQVIADDALLDQAQREVDDMAISLLARRQPMAQDLREILSAIRISAELERVGDMGKNIAKRVVAMSGTNHPSKLYRGLQALSELARTQLKDVLDAYASRSVDRLAYLRDRDNQIDAMYTSLFRELLTYMMEDPRNISTCTHLLFCAKNIERIGDHATNVAEILYYIVTGQQLDHHRAKDDETHRVTGMPIA
ncbi:phosphate signaling complex protein PhoU [Limoniibacter endophyticus]|uniref:Phosphate-specific transport system accessory protein PhoU n=1 Tax=Limoniibacter endophyticus TaxID=1565040 RepID=A0A8J3DQH9_9HYPH|nr:phosphate signaling complex protein PhoU [Limoniibacter endophyticus]GHC80356.1 phosphate transport system regulatory protein PhoU [Limoniibacter endophyticus]